MAKNNQLRCVVVTPERALLDEAVDFVAIPMYDGELGVLPDRAPLIGKLGFGELRIEKDGKTSRYFIDGGFAQIRDNVVTLLTSRAQPASELNQSCDRGGAAKCPKGRDNSGRARRIIAGPAEGPRTAAHPEQGGRNLKSRQASRSVCLAILQDRFDLRRLHDLPRARRPVDRQRAVEVIQLMLHHAGRESLQIYDARIALGIQITHAHRAMPGHQHKQFRKAQAPFPPGTLLCGSMSQAWIDEYFDLGRIIRVIRRKNCSQEDAPGGRHLRRRQTHAPSVLQRLSHVFQEILEVGRTNLVRGYFGRDLTKDRLTKLSNGKDHERPADGPRSSTTILL